MPLHTMVRRPLVWAVFTGLLSSASVVQAQAAINAGLAINRVSWQLVDLDPNDGVTPSITFTAPDGFSAYVNVDGVSRFVLNDPLDGSSWACCNTYPYTQSISANIDAVGPLSSPFGRSAQSVTSLDNTATGTLSTDGFGVSVKLTGQDLVTSREPVRPGVNGEQMAYGKDWVLSSGGYGGYGYGGTSQVREVFAADGSITGYTLDPSAIPSSSPYFTVSANTAVVFSGELAASASVDPTLLGDVDPSTTNFGAGGYAVFEVSRYQPKDGQTSWLTQEEVQNAFETDTAYLNFALPEGVTNASDQRAFTLRFVNASSGSVNGLVDMYASVGAGAAGVAAIPEPSTYALMAMGLLGVCVASRKRQAKAA
jgi:hypothetical protein